MGQHFICQLHIFGRSYKNFRWGHKPITQLLDSAFSVLNNWDAAEKGERRKAKITAVAGTTKEGVPVSHARRLGSGHETAPVSP